MEGDGVNMKKTAATHTYDFLVIGGGVIGINIAHELKRRFPQNRIGLLEKEGEAGYHASGRNSGVLHAGFYYTADSLKARFTREGNADLTQYCAEQGLRINPCGKLVVARNEAEVAQLDLLLARGIHNGVTLEKITAEEAQRIDPQARTTECALYSPATASVDPREVLNAMHQEAVRDGVDVHFNTPYLGGQNREVRTAQGLFSCGYLVNAAGLQADRVAHAYGFGLRYHILPFKGLYLYVDEPALQLATHIYPVPNLSNPFLGTHFTKTVDGRIKIGPTAIPAFWREQYQGFSRFSWTELFDIVGRQAGLFLHSAFDFKRLALSELRKYHVPYLLNQAAELVHGLSPQTKVTWGKPGIRAQLLDVQEKRLEMDFVLEGDAQSMHVLNAVSPAFTCCRPFSRHVVDEILKFA